MGTARTSMRYGKASQIFYCRVTWYECGGLELAWKGKGKGGIIHYQLVTGDGGTLASLGHGVYDHEFYRL